MKTDNTYKKIDGEFKNDLNYLGFFCWNLFESDFHEIKLENILNAELLNEEFDNLKKNENIISKIKSSTFGPFDIHKLTKKDFTKLNHIELITEIDNYCKDENWGNDLPIFKDNIKYVFNKLEFNLSEKEFYYINMETTDNQKLINPNFWSYFVAIISIEKNSNKIITSYFGLD